MEFTFDKTKLARRNPHLKDVIKLYQAPDNEIQINAHLRQDGDDYYYEKDEDLKPIVINIPKLIDTNAKFWSHTDPPTDILNPKWELVDGFGLHPEDQWFRIPEPPQQLIDLEKNYYELRERKRKTDRKAPEWFWHVLYRDAHKYQESIAYISKMKYHIRYGFWFFANGKPTYMDGWHFRQLIAFKQGSFSTRQKFTRAEKAKHLEKMKRAEAKGKTIAPLPEGKMSKSKVPEYRDRARKAFLTYKWCYTDTTDHTGRDYGIKTCFGYIYPKNRRVGATADAMTMLADISSIVRDSYNSIIGNAKNTGKTTFATKFVKTWQRQPVWLKAMHEGTLTPKSKLNNSAPPRKNQDELLYEDHIESATDYADKADRSYYDHAEISGFILMDEEGKTTATDILIGWGLVKPTMAPGGGTNILKYSMSAHPSTVEEMDSGGGRNYQELCSLSDYYSVNPDTGQTSSGLRLMYIPSPEGFEGFVGKYGESLIENLTEDQKSFIGKKIGSREFIENKLRLEKKKGTIEGDKAYAQFKRQNPIYYKDCWTIVGENNGFNMDKLGARATELVMHPPKKERGNLYWKIKESKGVYTEYSAAEYIDKFGIGDNPLTRSGKVIFKPEKHGRFYVTEVPPAHLTNCKVRREDTFYCTDYQYVSSSDTFDYLKEREFKAANSGSLQEEKLDTRMSKGAGAVLKCKDVLNDTNDKNVFDWNNYHFVCDYVHRPKSSTVYCEEMLMMTLLWSCLHYPERNKAFVYQHFVQRGYDGFLLYPMDNQGRIAEKPGFYTGGDNKQPLFDIVRNYVEYHIWKENHERVLNEFIKIKGMDDMTNRDLFVAAAGCLKGQEQITMQASPFQDQSTREEANINDWY